MAASWSGKSESGVIAPNCGSLAAARLRRTFEQIAPESLQIGAAAVEFAHRGQGRRGVLTENRLGQSIDLGAAGDAQGICHQALGYRAGGQRERRLQHPFRVAHAAFGLARQHSQGAVVGLNAFAAGQLAQALQYNRERNPAEIVTLQPRQDGFGHLLRLGRREDELDMRGRLFQRLEQGVEGLIG